MSALEPRTLGRAGHVESYFFRANDPRAPRALWVKATILAPLVGPPVAEAWFIWFDGDRVSAHKETVPYAEASFSATNIQVGPLRLGLGADPLQIQGQVSKLKLSLALEARRAPGLLGQPFSLYPEALLRGAFPRSKILTPAACLSVTGALELDGQRIELDGWSGMLGHNWGKEHARQYAWGQCLFLDARGVPEAMVEGFSGKVEVLGRRTPWVSALIVRRGSEEFRFDRLYDLWAQNAVIDRRSWELSLSGPGGEAHLMMRAPDRPWACLGYQNPDGRLSYCFNTKLAEVELKVQPRQGHAFVLRSAHGGALELLRDTAEPNLEVV
ncbi:MAG: hypothetical protein U1E65_02620 [Myxococcota bacterium]